jgi:hypothetical protein
MSGGRYAPAKAPERRCMPLIQWPAADRQLWEDALTPGTILDDHLGARAHLSATSNRKTERGYGRCSASITMSGCASIRMSACG